MSEVPVIVLEHLSEAERRALVIADNRLALNAGWDEEMLALELGALREEDFNLDVLGFDDEELTRLLAAEDAAEMRGAQEGRQSSGAHAGTNRPSPR